jgi:hypothetical protein
LLYAGSTFFCDYKEKWFHPIRWLVQAKKVTNLNQGHEPIGSSSSLIIIGTSESSCKSIESKSIERSRNNEVVQWISNHVPTHTKPLTDEDFGHYLAGLIDGDGWFIERGVRIVFNALDASLAYYIKRRLGYGSVSKVKSKNAVLLTICKREALEKVINLVNGKLRIQNKIDAVREHLLNVYKTPLEIKEELHINTSSDLNNHWLAGFIDADGSFQIKVLDRVTPETGGKRIEVRLYLQIDQKTRLLLDLIKENFGGNIGHRSSQATYYYNSTSFNSARLFIKYLDQYHLLSSKHINYLKWRKAYILVQSRKHLTPEGQEKIKRLKSSMNNYSKETLDL